MVFGVDNKASVVVLLEVVRMIIQYNLLYRDVDFVFIWGEECGYVGVVVFDVGCFIVRMGLMMDDMWLLGYVIVFALVYCSIHVRFIGRVAHVGVVLEYGINVIAAVAAVIGCMRFGWIDVEIMFNIGFIWGGTVRNLVFGLVEIEVEVRSCDNGKFAVLVDFLWMVL